MPSKPSWQAWLADEFAVASLMAIELEAGKIGHHRLKQRLALDKRQGCRVAAIQMQEGRRRKRPVHAARSVGRGLGLGEARKAVVADAAQLAVEIGGLRAARRERRQRARIFGAPVEPGAGQQLYLAALDARSHAKAVELDLVQPLRP